MRATDLLERIKQLHTIRRVFVRSARLHGIPDLAVFGDNRSMQANNARAIAYWVAHRQCGHSLKTVGMAVDRDHSTVLHAVQRVDTAILSTPAVHEMIERLIASLDHPPPPEIVAPPLPRIIKKSAVVPAEKLPASKRVYVASAEAVADVTRLRRLGWSYTGISRHLGLSTSIVQAIIADTESTGRRTA